jgi:hypothetical protein
MNNLEKPNKIGTRIWFDWDRDDSSLQIWRNITQDEHIRNLVRRPFTEPNYSTRGRILSQVLKALQDYRWRETQNLNRRTMSSGFSSRFAITIGMPGGGGGGLGVVTVADAPYPQAWCRLTA